MRKPHTKRQRWLLGAFYVFVGILFLAVWPRVSWVQRAVDAFLAFCVGRIVYSEVRRGR